MARSSNILTARSANTPSATAKPKTVKGSASVLAIVSAAIMALKTTVQSIGQLEVKIQEAALATLKHAANTGDHMPMDRLIKGMQEHPHPLTKNLVHEVVAYFRKNSPVRWDSKGQVKALKEGDEGYTPFDIVTAEAESFFETKQAKAARSAASAAGKKALEALTFKDVLGRSKGIAKTVERALLPDSNNEVRGINPKDKATIDDYLSELDKFNRNYTEKLALSKAA